MKYLIISVFSLFCIPIWAQPCGSLNRKAEITAFTKQINSGKEFQHIADSLHMTVDELCDYPVIFPIKNPKRISSGFGWRKHPITKVRQFHTGIDIPEVRGAAVYATGNGTVSKKGYNSGYGYYIEVTHAGGFRTFYAHLSKILVNVGDSVVIAGQIGCVGNTGVSTGSHLHYEVRKGKRFLNPKEWCYCLSEMPKEDNKSIRS